MGNALIYRILNKNADLERPKVIFRLSYSLRFLGPTSIKTFRSNLLVISCTKIKYNVYFSVHTL